MIVIQTRNPACLKWVSFDLSSNLLKHMYRNRNFLCKGYYVDTVEKCKENQRIH